jgi:hypothetical protein
MGIMKNKICQKVLKRVVIFFGPLVLLLSVMSFAQADEYFVDLGNYNSQIWDYSGYHSGYTIPDTLSGYIIPDTLYTEMVMFQDSKGKLIGYGAFYLVGDDGGIDDEFPIIDFDLKGTVKASNGSLTLKYKTKAEASFCEYGECEKIKLKESVSLELAKRDNNLYGTNKIKICASGLGCESDTISFFMFPPLGMTGEAVLSIDVEPDLAGKKLEGSGALILSNGDIFPLYAKGKYNSKNNETKLSLKGVDESTKGIKFKLIINEGSGVATGIKAKALGQKLIY